MDRLCTWSLRVDSQRLHMFVAPYYPRQEPKWYKYNDDSVSIVDMEQDSQLANSIAGLQDLQFHSWSLIADRFEMFGIIV